MRKHPAKYTDNFLVTIADLLYGFENVLDPFAGTGKIVMIKNWGFKGKIICNEIEKEWSIYKADEWHFGDAEKMNWASDSSISAICTSPTYGNRMADHFNARDESKRFTYKHFLGKDLNDQNTGKMQWGKKYRQKHLKIYKECFRVLKNKALMIINVSDHIRNKKNVPVSDWHKKTILGLGFTLRDVIKLSSPRMKFGENPNRANFENLFVFELNKGRE